MSTIFIEIGAFCVALIFAVYFQIASETKKSRDCLLFGRLLWATASIMTVDTIGWVIDGVPVGGQVWFTTVIDGLDLINTTLVCWCWVQYAVYIAKGEQVKTWKWYQDFATLLLLLQVILVSSSQIFGFYFSVDDMGCYHRERGYFVHFAISVTMLLYSSLVCIKEYLQEKEVEKKRELFFVAFIILIPILGNVFQLFVYGYPTVWLCMVFMIFTVYVHIQNKRINMERERQNKKLEIALKQAQIASSAKTDFLSHMSHDMRTPMNAILGITSLLKDRTDPVEISMDIEQIERSGKYLLNLINDTLDMNKIESGKLELHPEPTNSEEMFSNVLTTAQVLASKKGVHLILELPDIKHGEWVPVVADSSRVEQIFINIISNAIKFTPQGGDVKIHMDSVAIKEDSVTDRYVVEDTGIGMSEAFLQHLFEPFTQEGRGNNDHESGTGLGLAIVKQIVELMGGTITVESQLDHGTKITVMLTYPRYHGQLNDTPDKIVDWTILQGKRVLLCEDHPINAQIAIRLLEKQGMLVERAENGQVGVDMLKASEEHYYDAILMDIRMPVVNGLEATRVIRQITDREDVKKIPIIAMTANAFEEDIRNSKDAGMNAHLAKPIEPDKLYDELARQLSCSSCA